MRDLESVSTLVGKMAGRSHCNGEFIPADMKSQTDQDEADET